MKIELRIRVDFGRYLRGGVGKKEGLEILGGPSIHICPVLLLLNPFQICLKSPGGVVVENLVIRIAVDIESPWDQRLECNFCCQCVDVDSQTPEAGRKGVNLPPVADAVKRPSEG